LPVTVTRDVSFAGALAVRQLTDKVNAGAPDSYRDAGMHSLSQYIGVSQPMNKSAY